MKWTEPAYAKLNLTPGHFRQIGKRLPQPLHGDAIGVPVRPGDTDTGEEVSGLQVACGNGAPSGPENIVWRAAQSFFDYCGIQDRDALFQIEKHIPSQAGMGGGSSDGAAALRLLNRAYGTGFHRRCCGKLEPAWGRMCPSASLAAPCRLRALGRSSRLWPLCRTASSFCASRRWG